MDHKCNMMFQPQNINILGTSMESTNPTPQKNHEEGSNRKYVSTLMEFDVFTFSSNFWATILMINFSN